MTLNKDFFLQLQVRLSAKKRFDRLRKEEGLPATLMLETLMDVFKNRIK